MKRTKGSSLDSKTETRMANQAAEQSIEQLKVERTTAKRSLNFKRCLKVPGRPQPPSYQVGLKKKDQLHSQSSLEANVISTHGEETGRHSRERGNNRLERGKKGSILGQSR